MAYDEQLAQRIRTTLGGNADFQEKKMFGVIWFLVAGVEGAGPDAEQNNWHMACGLNGGDLMVHVGPERHAHALAQPHAAAVEFTGKSRKGFVTVRQEGTRSERGLAKWIGEGLAYAQSLPPNPVQKRGGRRGARKA